jgi:hypothetical protein
MTHRILLSASLLAIAPFAAAAGGMNESSVTAAPTSAPVMGTPSVAPNGNLDGF